MPAEPTIVYLARGKLFVRQAGELPREIESPFAKGVIDRQLHDRELNGWKGRSGIWAGMGMAPPQMEQWDQAGEAGIREPRATAIARSSIAGRIVYVLDLINVGGLFEYDLEKKTERRLMHKEGFAAGDLAIHPTSGMYVLSLARENQTVRLATSEQEGRYLSIVTAGDCVDEAPAWLNGEDKEVLFQSAPVGRNQSGFPIGLGPYAIRRADLKTEEVATLVESPTHDHLYPRPTTDGGLHFVRRPYKPPGQKQVPLKDIVLDVVLLPYRVLRTGFYFLNFMSQMFAGKPLATTLGTPPNAKAQDRPFLMLWGQMIDTKKALADTKKNDDAGLVPQQWELIRRDRAGAETVLARNVLAYDIAADGSVIYTNGAAVFWLSPAGEKQRLCQGELIEKVIVVG